MDQTDAAVNLGIPLGIASLTAALLKWTCLPKWGAVLGGIVGGIIIGFLYAIPIFFMIGFIGFLIDKKRKGESANQQMDGTRP